MSTAATLTRPASPERLAHARELLADGWTLDDLCGPSCDVGPCAVMNDPTVRHLFAERSAMP